MTFAHSSLPHFFFSFKRPSLCYLWQLSELKDNLCPPPLLELSQLYFCKTNPMFESHPKGENIMVQKEEWSQLLFFCCCFCCLFIYVCQCITTAGHQPCDFWFWRVLRLFRKKLMSNFFVSIGQWWRMFWCMCFKAWWGPTKVSWPQGRRAARVMYPLASRRRCKLCSMSSTSCTWFLGEMTQRCAFDCVCTSF